MARDTAKHAAKDCNKVLANVTSDHPALADPWCDNFNRWFVCDGYRAYRLNRQPNGLMVHWSVHTLSDVMRTKYITVHNAVEAMFDADILEKISEVPVTYETVIDVYRNSEDGTIDLGEDFPVVNVKYLRDYLLIPFCIIHYGRAHFQLEFYMSNIGRQLVELTNP